MKSYLRCLFKSSKTQNRLMFKQKIILLKEVKIIYLC